MALAELTVGDAVVATYVDGADLAAELAPRPFLHPVRTLAGTVATDAVPEDHRWHLGVCLGVQDVAGANLWGGRTYVRGEGYTWLPDHGVMAHVGWRRRAPGLLDQDLSWRGPDGAELLRERRELAARPVEGGWALDIAFTLVATGEPRALGSPATNGRDGAGYGGLFWRLPRRGDVFTPEARGEDAVHGSRAPWIAYQGANGAPFTLVLGATDPETAADPWFVRLAGYPGIGSSLAATSPVVVGPEPGLRRAFTAVLADGHPPVEDLWRAAQRG